MPVFDSDVALESGAAVPCRNGQRGRGRICRMAAIACLEVAANVLYNSQTMVATCVSRLGFLDNQAVDWRCTRDGLIIIRHSFCQYLACILKPIDLTSIGAASICS